jgi:hypothetical protein
VCLARSYQRKVDDQFLPELLVSFSCSQCFYPVFLCFILSVSFPLFLSCFSICVLPSMEYTYCDFKETKHVHLSISDCVHAAYNDHACAVVMKCMQMPAAASNMFLQRTVALVSFRCTRPQEGCSTPRVISYCGSVNPLSVADFLPQREHRKCQLFKGTKDTENRNCCLTETRCGLRTHPPTLLHWEHAVA